MDSALIPKGVKRCPLWQFALFIGAVGVVLLWGVYAMLLCWFKGLNQTNMNDYYGFALWIWADLAVIAIDRQFPLGCPMLFFLRVVSQQSPEAWVCRLSPGQGWSVHSSPSLERRGSPPPISFT